jgi:hypothetical protein
MGNMWNRYVIAQRNEMIIRLVEPDEFIGRTIDERRPLAFRHEVNRFEGEGDTTFTVALAICLLLVVSFGGLVACALDVVLSCL